MWETTLRGNTVKIKYMAFICTGWSLSCTPPWGLLEWRINSMSSLIVEALIAEWKEWGKECTLSGKFCSICSSIFYVVGFPATPLLRKAIFTSQGSTNHLRCPKSAAQRFINRLLISSPLAMLYFLFVYMFLLKVITTTKKEHSTW